MRPAGGREGSTGAFTFAARVVLARVRAYTAVFGAVAMTLAALSLEIVNVVAPTAYRTAALALPGLVFAAACDGLVRPAGIGADFGKRTRVWAITSTLSLTLGLGLTTVLVPRIGIAGAAIGWAAATATAVLVAYRAGRAVSGVVLPIGRAVLVLAGGAAISTIAVFQAWAVLARLGLLAGFAVAAFAVLRPKFRDWASTAEV